MTHSGSVIQQEDQNRAIICWQVMQRAAIILLPILAVTVLLSVEINITGACFYWFLLAYWFTQNWRLKHKRVKIIPFTTATSK